MITGLAVSNIRKNKSRSILIMSSIFMTTMLLMVIATMGYGLAKTEKVNAGAFAGSYYGIFGGAKEENIREMERRSEFTDIGRMAGLGNAGADENYSLVYADADVRAMTNQDRQLQEGSFPEKENEIAACPAFFQGLGIENPKTGDTVSISYRTGLHTPFQEGVFVISGLLKKPENADLMRGAVGYISQAYYETQIPEAERSYSVYFALDESIGLTVDSAMDYMKELAGKCGIDERYVVDNYAYLMWKLEPGTEMLVGCLMIALLVILFSMVVIYNIFQVGLVQRIQEYGRIKALGATRKQMRDLIKREGQLLSALSIPPGLLTGYLAGVLGMNIMWGEMQLEGATKVSPFSVWILLLAAILAYVTVRLALRRAGRIVASISPVEAMRYQESASGTKGCRKGKKYLTVGGMTMANLSGNKRRTITTVVSMGLSCVLFVVIANFVGNIDVEYDARRNVPHGQFQLELNYRMNDTVYTEKNLDSILKENPLGQEMQKKIAALPGVTEVTTGKILYGIVDGDKKNPVSVLVLNREDFMQQMDHGGLLGTFTYEEAAEQDALIYGASHWMEDAGYKIGQESDLELFDGVKEQKFSSRILGAFGMAESDFVITEDTCQRLNMTGESTYNIWVDCKEKDVEAVEKELKELLFGVSNVELASYRQQYEQTASAVYMMRLGGYLLGGLIAVISFLNMANTLITSIVTRKQEFGVLQAIGMTNRQLNYSLSLEGIFFTAGTVLVSAAVGIPLGYGVFYYGSTHGWIGLHQYHFPWLEILAMIGVLVLLQTALSFILSRNVKKESLVERIRYQE